jgi:hypothetical protein
LGNTEESGVMVGHGTKSTGPKKANSNNDGHPLCLFCLAEIDKPRKVTGGGRVSFCNICIEQLENKGLLKRNEAGTIELIKPLLDVIGEF